MHTYQSTKLFYELILVFLIKNRWSAACKLNNCQNPLIIDTHTDTGRHLKNT